MDATGEPDYCEKCRVRIPYWESFEHTVSGLHYCAGCLRGEAPAVAQQWRDENDRPAPGDRRNGE